MNLFRLLFFILFVTIIQNNALAAQTNIDKLGEQLMMDGINLGYVSACIAGGMGDDYQWADKRLGPYFRNKYKQLDEIYYQGIFRGAIDNGIERAKSSSASCEQKFAWILKIYKNLGLNPEKILIGRKAFLERRKKVYGY